MRSAKMTVAGLAVLVWLGSARAETVKLELKGAYWPGCAKALAKALGEVPGVKVQGALKPTKEAPQFVSVDLDTTKSDIGELAKAVGGCPTPHKEKVEPCLAVVIPTKADTEKLQKALADVKGVVAKESRVENGQAIIHLDEKGGAKMSEIKKAVDSLSK